MPGLLSESKVGNGKDNEHAGRAGGTGGSPKEHQPSSGEHYNSIKTQNISN